MYRAWRIDETTSWFDGRQIINLIRDVYDEDNTLLGQEYLRDSRGECIEFESRQAAGEYMTADYLAAREAGLVR